MAIWKCNNCGNTLDVLSPPEVCPSCKEKCEFVDVSCYIPDCGGTEAHNINAKVFQDSYHDGKKR